ncbi:hypothetical protein X759_20940 [Mesorhizobium sp. LSHC420B00]|nr:hypothetical protein X759_20940 [Mesorhizobium sp. LSHC420B00]
MARSSATDELHNSVSACTMMMEMNKIPFCTKPSKEAYMRQMLNGALRSTVGKSNALNDAGYGAAPARIAIPL